MRVRGDLSFINTAIMPDNVGMAGVVRQGSQSTADPTSSNACASADRNAVA